MYFDKWSKCMTSLKMKKNPINTNRLIVLWVYVFLILYVNKIFLIKNDISYITENKSFLLLLFSTKDLRKASLILGMKIYINRSKRLLGLSQSNVHIVFMSKIYSVMYIIYEIGYGILTRGSKWMLARSMWESLEDHP